MTLNHRSNMSMAMGTALEPEQLVEFIAAIPDLRHHRFVDTDGEFSVKLHTDQEVAQRVAEALKAEGLHVVRPVKVAPDPPDFELPWA